MRRDWLVRLFPVLLIACGTSSTASMDGTAGDGKAGGNADGGNLDSTGVDGPAQDMASSGKMDTAGQADKPIVSGNNYVYVAGNELAVYKIDTATGALAATGAKYPQSGGFVWDSKHRYLYVVVDPNILAFSINAQDGSLAKINQAARGPGAGDAPTAIAIDKSDKWLFVSDYHSGQVTVHPIKSDGGVGDRVDLQQAAGNHAHSVNVDPTGNFVFVPCVHDNYIAQYKLDLGTGKLLPNTPPTAGSGVDPSLSDEPGPRHMAFHPNGKFAYSIDEDSTRMSTYSYDSTKGTLTSIQVLPTTENGVHASCADVVVHPSGKFVYGTNRGDKEASSVAIFTVGADGKLTFVATENGGGMMRTPQGLAFDPSGKYLLSANADLNVLFVFEINQTTGKLTLAGMPKVPGGASVVSSLTLP